MKKRGCLFWLVVVGSGLFVLGFVASLVIHIGITNSDASQAAERLVDEHPDLVAFIGGPTSIDWLRSGSISTNETLGVATFTLTVAGSRGEVEVRVLLLRASGSDEWEPIYAAVVDGEGRAALGLDPARFPAKTEFAKGLRERAAQFRGAGALDIQLDGKNVRLVRWDR